MRVVLTIVFVFLFCNISQAQFLRVSGTIADSSKAPIPGVNIFIVNGSLMAITDNLGKFSFELPTGEYEIAFNHSQYQRVKIKVVLTDKDDTINVILPELVESMATIQVRSKRIEFGPIFMKKAIEKREYWASKLPHYSADLYIRAWEEYKKNKKKENVWHTPENNGEKKDTSTKKNKKKTEEQTQQSMAEIVLKLDYAGPNKTKELRTGVSKRGDVSGLFYLRTSDGEFNFYQNLVNIPAISNAPIMSPLSNTALLAYKFTYLGSYKNEKGKKILKIKMSPRGITNSAFSGEIHLVDSLFCIYRTEIYFPKNLMAEYDEFLVSQEYQFFGDTQWMYSKQRFDYFAKAGQGKFTGYTLVNYKNLEINKKFPKKYFNLEISATTDSAYERDSAYWAKQRTIPLNAKEIKYITKVDSIKRVFTSDKYLDSMEKKNNKIKFVKLFFLGQTYDKRSKGISLGFQPLAFIWQPWHIGGSRLFMYNTIQKKFKNKKEVFMSENISYGLRNKDWRGNVSFYHLYNPFRRSYIRVDAGKSVALINGFATIASLLQRANFFQTKYISLTHNTELINGLYFYTNLNFTDRKDITNLRFAKLGDSIFDNYKTPLVGFEPSRALYMQVGLTYTPFQKYIREPKRKLVLGSRWPTIGIFYKKAIPSILNSTIDYEFIEARLDHEFPIGLFGNSELKMNSGYFISRKKVLPPDYRYQRAGDAFFMIVPMYTFQMLDTTFTTFKPFVEAHYRHHFNGSLINKLVILKPLGLQEVAGVSLLYAPERRNMFFYEFYAGLEKQFRIFRDRFKLGFYYCGGYSNIFSAPRFQFKIFFDSYNRQSNSWTQ